VNTRNEKTKKQKTTLTTPRLLRSLSSINPLKFPLEGLTMTLKKELTSSEKKLY
jgi:hypothetical protein